MTDSAARRWVAASPPETRLFLSAAAMVIATSTPTLGAVGAAGTAKLPGWLLDGTTSESVMGAVRLPSSWTTFSADLWWSNGGAGSGNVVWRVDRGIDADTAAPPAVTSATLAAIAAPAQNVVKVTVDALTGIAVPTVAQVLALGATRLPADAGDTLANDAILIGFMLKRAS